MDFVTEPPISTNWKGDNYDSMLVIINPLIKMVYYELVKCNAVARDLVTWPHWSSNSVQW